MSTTGTCLAEADTETVFIIEVRAVTNVCLPAKVIAAVVTGTVGCIDRRLQLAVI